jgi:lipopolysaccharide transport system permease protein
MDHHVTKVYTSESHVRHPGQLFSMMISDLFTSRSLAWTLMKRDISAQYRQSFLGIAWAFIPAIFTALTFTLASSNKVLNVPPTDIPYGAYIIFSVILWQVFSESVMAPVTGLSNARSFVSKINFPREALFLAKLGEVLFNVVIKSLLIIGVFIYYQISPSVMVVGAVGLLCILTLAGIAIGLLMAPLAMIYQDFTKGLPLVLALGMFLTPIVYPMPDNNSTLGTIVRINPITYLINGIRDLTIRGSTLYSSEIIIVSISSVILLMMSWAVYRLSMPYVIERCP